jgi:hypothetical protein
VAGGRWRWASAAPTTAPSPEQLAIAGAALG